MERSALTANEVSEGIYIFFWFTWICCTEMFVFDVLTFLYFLFYIIVLYIIFTIHMSLTTDGEINVSRLLKLVFVHYKFIQLVVRIIDFIIWLLTVLLNEKFNKETLFQWVLSYWHSPLDIWLSWFKKW